jgi:hypothetical protein
MIHSFRKKGSKQEWQQPVAVRSLFDSRFHSNFLCSILHSSSIPRRSILLSTWFGGLFLACGFAGLQHEQYRFGRPFFLP